MGYCFNMKTTIEDEKMKDKISDDDRKAINDKCDEAIKWLDANQLAEVEEFNEKQKEVEAVCNPIITKLYQSAGGAGMPDMGGMPGGMPGAGGAGGATQYQLPGASQTLFLGSSIQALLSCDTFSTLNILMMPYRDLNTSEKRLGCAPTSFSFSPCFTRLYTKD